MEEAPEAQEGSWHVEILSKHYPQMERLTLAGTLPGPKAGLGWIQPLLLGAGPHHTCDMALKSRPSLENLF
jgi:hypothetical protein